MKAAKTTLYAKSKLAINTWALTLKIKTPNKFARYYKKNVDVETIEKNPAGKAAKAKLYAKSQRIAVTGATSTPAHLIFTKPWFYQTSSVPNSSVPHLEFTTGVREQ